MDQLNESIIEHFEELMDEGNEILELISNLNKGSGYPIYYEKLNGSGVARVNSWVSRCGQFIKNICTEESIYYRRFETVLNEFEDIDKNSDRVVGIVLGSIKAVYSDYKEGMLTNVRNLLRAEIFTDFLEMGEYLLNEGYKDAAAVIIGSVLEDTLKKLSIQNDIEILNHKGKNKTIQPLNQELGKEGVYNKLTEKRITSWGDLRNNAAHGHYDEYDAEQVKMMLLFVQEFCSDNIS